MPLKLQSCCTTCTLSRYTESSIFAGHIKLQITAVDNEHLIFHILTNPFRIMVLLVILGWPTVLRFAHQATLSKGERPMFAI